MKRTYRSWLAASALACAGAAQAAETVSYGYDSLGRLVRVDRSGTATAPVAAAYRYDRSDNRIEVAVAVGSAPPPAPPPVFSIAGGSADEGASLVFTVTRSGSAAGSYSVAYATSNGSASAGSDYVAASGTLTFAAAGSRTVSVATLADSAAEPAETLTMILSAPSGGASLAAGASQATGTINASTSGSNSPPVTAADSASVPRCGSVVKDVVANDLDPDGHYPLALSAISYYGLRGTASIASSTSILFAAGNATGSATVGYTVRDSLGATATGTFTVTLTADGTCP